MEKTTQIRALLRAITGTDRPVCDFHLMEVMAVKGDLCQARLGDLLLSDIRLASVSGGSDDGLLLTPAVGSMVLVADRSCGMLRELHVVGYAEIASVRFHQGRTTLTADAAGAKAAVGDSRIRIDADGIAFNAGDNGGLVKIEELRRSMDSLQRYCETLKIATVAGLLGVGAGAAANGGTGADKFEEVMATASIRIENMENEKVKH